MLSNEAGVSLGCTSPLVKLRVGSSDAVVFGGKVERGARDEHRGASDVLCVSIASTGGKMTLGRLVRISAGRGVMCGE